MPAKRPPCNMLHKHWFLKDHYVFVTANAKGTLPAPEIRKVMRVTKAEVELLRPDGQTSYIMALDQVTAAVNSDEFKITSLAGKLMAMYIKPPLRQLYAMMAALTGPKCAACPGNTIRKTRCCDQMYCLGAELEAKELYGITLERTNPAGPLFFMGPNGCTLEPHLRPTCTVHHCDIASMGYFMDHDKQREPMEEDTNLYFMLRDAIELAHSFQDKPNA